MFGPPPRPTRTHTCRGCPFTPTVEAVSMVGVSCGSTGHGTPTRTHRGGRPCRGPRTGFIYVSDDTTWVLPLPTLCPRVTVPYRPRTVTPSPTGPGSSGRRTVSHQYRHVPSGSSLRRRVLTPPGPNPEPSVWSYGVIDPGRDRSRTDGRLPGFLSPKDGCVPRPGPRSLDHGESPRGLRRKCFPLPS